MHIGESRYKLRPQVLINAETVQVKLVAWHISGNPTNQTAEITIRVSDKALKAAGVLLGAVFLLWGFSQLWSSGVLRPKYQIQMFVPESAGAQGAAPVRLDGMPVGSVSVVSPSTRRLGRI
jgi:hypothetical protein